MDSEKYPIHKYIYEWLLNHESIVVPELGQFVAEFKGASIHPSIHSISPPNKTVVFKSEPKNDDGELIGFIAQKESLSNFEAEELIKKFVSELKIALASDQKYELPAFGVFTKNPEGAIEFDADEAINFSGDSFGFSKLFYKPVEKKEDSSFFDREFDTSEEAPYKKEEEITSNIEDKTITKGFGTANDDHVKTPFDDDDDDDLDDDDFDDERRRPRWLMPVVGILAAGLVITAGVYFVPKMLGGSSKKTAKKDSTEAIAKNNTDTNTITSTEVKLDDTTNTGGTSTTDDGNTTTTSETNTDNNNTSTGNTTSSNTNTGSSGTSGTTASTTTTTTTTPTYTPPANTGGTNNNLFKTLPYRPQSPGSTAIISTPTSRFYIIVASFGEKTNAYSLYNNLKAQGYDAKIIPPIEGSNMHRVASGSYTSEDEANRNLRRLNKRLGNDIWVKKY